MPRLRWLLLCALCGSLQAAPLRVAYVSALGAERDEADIAELRRTIEADGIAGVQIQRVAFPSADDPRALLAAARRLLADGPYALVVTTANSPAVAIQRLAPHQPLVFQSAADPVGTCLVDRLTHPGRNATGYTSAMPAEPKMLEALLDSYPQVRAVEVLIDGNSRPRFDCGAVVAKAAVPPEPLPPPCQPGAVNLAGASQALFDAGALLAYADSRGRSLRFRVVCTAEQIAALGTGPGTYGQPETGAYLVPYHYLFYAHAQALAETLGRSGRPSVYPRPLFGQAGGLLVVAPLVEPERLPRTFELAVQVLRGRSPGSLPVQMPMAFEVWLNTDTARRMGLQPSPDSLRHVHHFIP